MAEGKRDRHDKHGSDGECGRNDACVCEAKQKRSKLEGRRDWSDVASDHRDKRYVTHSDTPWGDVWRGRTGRNETGNDREKGTEARANANGRSGTR